MEKAQKPLTRFGTDQRHFAPWNPLVAISGDRGRKMDLVPPLRTPGRFADLHSPKRGLCLVLPSPLGDSLTHSTQNPVFSARIENRQTNSFLILSLIIFLNARTAFSPLGYSFMLMRFSGDFRSSMASISFLESFVSSRRKARRSCKP